MKTLLFDGVRRRLEPCEDDGMGEPIELDCGIRCARIADWLDDELKLEREEDRWVFRDGGHSCRISLSPLANRVLGKLALERTSMRVEGDAQAIEVFNRLFTLRFISAGG